MRYQNPIIFSDYSDPDVIKYKNTYYMIASSFNHTPGVPVLKSKNLVDWKLFDYVFDKIPFKRFENVNHGDGAWAPSLRFHKGTFYAVIPFPDEGIYVSSTTDIEKGNWSEPWCLIEGKGIIDPCPIWHEDKCYLAVAFAKSRIGFNSVIAIYEVSNDLKENISKDYTIIYDGHNNNPTIEGPKFYYRNDYFYLMCPAGSVKTGWQTALRSKNIYGPYESKIVMSQNDSSINGPHQGALIPIDKDNDAFIHFQDLGVYGRVVNLEPVKWINDWPICGTVKDEMLGGTPVDDEEYFIDTKSNYKIELSDNFKSDKLSLMWQTPANKKDGWYKLENGLKLNCAFHNLKAFSALNLTPNLFLTKIGLKSFKVETLVEINLINDGDELGLCYMGSKYQYICIVRVNGVNHLQIRQGYFNQENDIVLFDSVYKNNMIKLQMKFKYPGVYQLGFNDIILKPKYQAYPGRWIGGKIGIYAKGIRNGGYARFKYYKVKKLGD